MKKLLSLVVVIDAPLTCLPQIIRIVRNHSSNDVSLLTWLMCCITSIIWACVANKDKSTTLTIGCSIWAIMDLLVLVLALVYRYGNV